MPRALVFQAFTDPEHLAKWWGPVGNSLPREDMHFDVRSGGHQRWTEVFASQPEVRVRIDFTLTSVNDGELLDGVMSVGGQLPGGVQPFTSRLRVEFHEEGPRRTRLEIQQWLPAAVAAPAEQGWGEALSKLETALGAAQTTTINNNEKGTRGMSKLIYVNNVSLDGYCEDENGVYDFGPMDPELLQAYNTVTAATPTFLYGRRLYEAMALWETDPSLAQRSPVTAEFAKVWQSATKIVYSTTLTEPWTQRTRIEREFDPAAVRQLKETATGDITVGGATLASQALNAGLVDECQLFVWPTAVGRGKPALQTAARTDLELLDQCRFDNGVLLLRYRPMNR